jgi:uncharacterized membrane protein HdeD (DUF308 family)
MTTNETDYLFWRNKAISAERGSIITVAVVAILFGVFVLVRPSSGLLTIAVFFGIYLVVSGVAGVAFALTSSDRSAGSRWLSGILGVLVVIAGFVCLLNLGTSLQVLGFTLGVGLLLVGVAELANSRPEQGRPTALRVVSGVLTIIAGIVMVIVPFISVGIIVFIGAIVLVVAGIAGLITLPELTRAQVAATGGPTASGPQVI